MSNYPSITKDIAPVFFRKSVKIVETGQEQALSSVALILLFINRWFSVSTVFWGI